MPVLDLSSVLASLPHPLTSLPLMVATRTHHRNRLVTVSLAAVLMAIVGLSASLWQAPPSIALLIAWTLLLGLGAGTVGCRWWMTAPSAAEQAAQARFEYIAQATNDAIWDYDVAQGTLWWSAGYRTLFGTDPSPNIDVWYESIHPDDRDRVQAKFRSASDGHTPEWSNEYRYRRADGTYANVVDRGAAIPDAQGRVVRMIGGMRDVTEHRLARLELRQMNEQLRSLASQYRALIDQSLAGILVIQDGRFRYVNPKLAHMCGASSQDLLAMPSAFDSVVEDDRASVAEAIRKRMSGKLIDTPTQLRWKRPDGTLVWAEVHGSRIEYEGMPALMGVAVDITDRREAEERQQRLLDQLVSAREQLQALSRQLMHVQEEERRHLARDMHDEIGQSLTVLKMNLQALAKSAGTTTTPPSITDPYDESLRIIDALIAHVRNLSLDLRPAMLDDLGLPETLRWFVQRQAGRAGWTADIDVQEELSEVTAGMALTCFRLIQECMTNVMRHASATHVNVHAGHDGHAVQIVVRDNGCGFDVPSALRRSAQGGSVGLLSMQERVRALNGRIDIESSPDRGTSVTVTLPLTLST